MNQTPTRTNQSFAALFGPSFLNQAPTNHNVYLRNKSLYYKVGLMNQTPTNKSSPYKNKSIFYGIIRSGLVESNPYIKKGGLDESNSCNINVDMRNKLPQFHP